jgi:sorting nexin-1/2
MLNKTAAHPTLQHDGDLKLFLESEAFNVDVKHKERKEPGLGESKGMFSSLNISVGSGSKFVEQDEVGKIYTVTDTSINLFSGSTSDAYISMPWRIN